MASIKHRIVDYVISASCLDHATGKPAGLAVERGRTRPVNADATPRIAVYVGPEMAEGVGQRHTGTPMRRQVTLYLEIRATGGPSPDEVLDPIAVWAEQRIFADEYMGGLAAGVVGWRVEQDARASDQTYSLATIAVDVLFVAVRGNPESQGGE